MLSTCPKGKHITRRQKSSLRRIYRREVQHVTSSGCWQHLFIIPSLLLLLFFSWHQQLQQHQQYQLQSIAATALINNATTWPDTAWMEASLAINPKWAPKETFENELREGKRPVNNINNILGEERRTLWCLNLFPLLCSIRRNVRSLSFSRSCETKKSSLLFQNSSSPPGRNPPLKWLSKELKATQRSQIRLFKLTQQQEKPIAV